MAGIKKTYTPEFKKKMVKLVLEEGRQMKSVNQEYNLGEGSLRKWIRDYSEECETNPELNNEKDQMAEILKLRKELASLQIWILVSGIRSLEIQNLRLLW